MYFEGAPTSETKRAHEQLAFHGATEGNEDAAAQAQGIENLSLIRETLYAALGDVMVETPSILGMLARGADWAPQAFFASTALAILDVALRRVDDNGVRPVHFGHGSPRYIGLGDTPRASFLFLLVRPTQSDIELTRSVLATPPRRPRRTFASESRPAGGGRRAGSSRSDRGRRAAHAAAAGPAQRPTRSRCWSHVWRRRAGSGIG